MSKLSNEELVRKAQITTDVIVASGKLSDAQADAFIDFVFDESILGSITRITRFRNENLIIDKIGVGQRVAVPKEEARDPGVRRGITASKVTITPTEVMVPFEISDTFKDVNLEGDTIEEKIIRLFARQTNNDLEELYIHGDTTGYMAVENDLFPGGSTSDLIADAYLALTNGFVRKAEGGNVVDLGGANISSNVFSRMLNAMPTKFKRDRSRLRWLMAVELEQLWRERISTRATGLGDQALMTDTPVMPYGIPAIPVPLLQFYVPQVEVKAFTGSGTTIQLDYAPIQAGSVTVVADADAGSIPTTPFIDTTDYVVDATLGTVTHAGGGSAIGTTESVRITYNSFPQIVLTHMDNLILAIGRDIRLERDRDIFKGVNQFALTVKVDVQIEELTAVVLGTNIGDTV